MFSLWKMSADERPDISADVSFESWFMLRVIMLTSVKETRYAFLFTFPSLFSKCRAYKKVLKMKNVKVRPKRSSLLLQKTLLLKHLVTSPAFNSVT